MDNTFFAYLQQLELFVFFSGYPLICLLINSLGTVSFIPSNHITRLKLLLPYTYALAGVLFLGFELKNLYPDLSIEKIAERMQHPFLVIWALLSMVFWIPFFRKRLLVSFLHSLIVFTVFVNELIHAKQAMMEDNSRFLNSMRVYTISILLYAILLFIFYLFSLAKDHFSAKSAR